MFEQSYWKRVTLAALVACAYFAAGPLGAGAQTPLTDLLTDRALWNRLTTNKEMRMTWDGAGALTLACDAWKGELQCAFARKLPLAGARLRLDLRFTGTPTAKTAGGARFDGVVTPTGEALSIAIAPEQDFIAIGDAHKELKSLVEDPYHFDLELVFGDQALQVFWGGRLVGEAPVVYRGEGGASSVMLFVAQGAMAVEQLALSGGASAPQPAGATSAGSGQAARSATEGANVVIAVNDKALTPLPSQWADYFGTHYASSPELAGVSWRTVRSYGGTHAGISQLESERGQGEPPRKGPFTGKDVRVALKDFHSQGMNKANARAADQLIPELIAHRITGINLITGVVAPSDAQPFDKDLAYWTVRLIHETFPAAKDNLVWQMGNEIVSGHFDPKGLNKSADGEAKAKRVAADGKISGYDLTWKREYYVNQYLAPAIEAVERAAQDIYGDPRALTIALGSMNPYNEFNKKFLKETMESSFDGRVAPSLEGDPVHTHLDLLTVHYMCGNDENMATMQQYLDQYVRTGKVKALWITEEHGRAGKGPVTILDRGLRFMAWVAKNGLAADQTRLVWWGEGQRAGGSGQEMMAQLGRFLKDRPLGLLEQRDGSVRYVALATKAIDRILVAILPAPSSSIDLGVLTLELPDGAAQREWQVEATQYSSLVPPETVAATVSREGSKLNIAISRPIAEPFVVWLAAPQSTMRDEGSR